MGLLVERIKTSVDEQEIPVDLPGGQNNAVVGRTGCLHGHELQSGHHTSGQPRMDPTTLAGHAERSKRDTIEIFRFARLTFPSVCHLLRLLLTICTLFAKKKKLCC